MSLYILNKRDDVHLKRKDGARENDQEDGEGALYPRTTIPYAASEAITIGGRRPHHPVDNAVHKPGDQARRCSRPPRYCEQVELPWNGVEGVRIEVRSRLAGIDTVRPYREYPNSAARLKRNK